MKTSRRVLAVVLVCWLQGVALTASAEDPASADAWRRAMELSDRQRFDEALHVIGEGLERDPANVDLSWLEASVVGWSGRHAESVARFEKLAAARPDLADALRVDLGTQRLWAGDPNGALREAEAVLEDEPFHAEAGHLRALALAHADRHAESLEAFDALIERRPGDVELVLDRALVLSWTGRNAEAVEAYEAVLREHPDNTRARIGLAQNENWCGKHRRAADMFDKLLEENHDDPEILKGLAFANYWADRPEAAEEAIARFRMARPEDREGNELSTLIRFEQDPTLFAGFEASDDSDDQQIQSATLDFRYPLARRLAVMAYVRDDRVEDPGGTEATLRFGAGVEKRWDRWKAKAQIGYFDGDTGASRGTGEVRATFRPRDGLEYAFGLESEPVLTRQSLALDIYTTSASAGVSWAPLDRLQLRAGADHRDYNDGNRATALSAVTRWQPRFRRHNRIALVFNLDLLRADQNLDNGYYDPEDYYELGPGVEWTKNFPGRLHLNLRARTGYQKERGGDGDTFYYLGAGAAIPLGRAMRLNLEVERSNSSLSTESGFELTRGAVYLSRAF